MNLEDIVWSKIKHKMTYTDWLLLCDVASVVKFIETASQMWLPASVGEGEGS